MRWLLPLLCLGACAAGPAASAPPGPAAPGPAASGAPAASVAPPAGPGGAAAALAAPGLGDPPPGFWTACREACARSNMMRAVAAWMIDAQCEDACRADWALPERATGAALTDAAGVRVRVRGRWRVDGEARAVALADGTVLSCQGGAALDLSASLAPGGAVYAVGVFVEGALRDVAVVASAE